METKQLTPNERKDQMNEVKIIFHRIKEVPFDYVTFVAYEPSSFMGPHSSIFSIEGQWFGKIGSRELPEELDALPARSEKRSKAVKTWQEAQYQEAYDAILAENPEAAEGSRLMGEITIKQAKEAAIA